LAHTKFLEKFGKIRAKYSLHPRTFACSHTYGPWFTSEVSKYFRPRAAQAATQQFKGRI